MVGSGGDVTDVNILAQNVLMTCGVPREQVGACEIRLTPATPSQTSSGSRKLAEMRVVTSEGEEATFYEAASEAALRWAWHAGDGSLAITVLHALGVFVHEYDHYADAEDEDEDGSAVRRWQTAAQKAEYTRMRLHSPLNSSLATASAARTASRREISRRADDDSTPQDVVHAASAPLPLPLPVQSEEVRIPWFPDVTVQVDRYEVEDEREQRALIEALWRETRPSYESMLIDGESKDVLVVPQIDFLTT